MRFCDHLNEIGLRAVFAKNDYEQKKISREELTKILKKCEKDHKDLEAKARAIGFPDFIGPKYPKDLLDLKIDE